jgi:DeoR/GlpR family transcriptional regulator of sugar metabolism
MSVLTQQRHGEILSELFAKQEVSVKHLAAQLGVSEATIRRDLKILADRGQLEPVHGGATLPRRTDLSFRSKSLLHSQAKQTIGRLAGELVHHGEQIFVDSGTTCFQMTPALNTKRGVSVIVNSARLALELDTPALSVILLGGQYRPDRMDTVGPLANATLEQLRGYIAFVSADGLSMDFGLTANDIESADLYRRAVANAREVVLLADATKFDNPSLFKIVGFDAVARIVTDQMPSSDWMEFFKQKNIEVICPETLGNPADGAPTE